MNFKKTDETIMFRDTCSDGKTSRERNYHTLQDYGQLLGTVTERELQGGTYESVGMFLVFNWGGGYL